MSELPARLAGNLILRSKEVELAAGQTVYKVGDETRSMCCILSGAVRMNIATNDNEHRFGHLISSGFCFGEYEWLTGRARLLEMQCALPTRRSCARPQHCRRSTRCWRFPQRMISRSRIRSGPAAASGRASRSTSRDRSARCPADQPERHHRGAQHAAVIDRGDPAADGARGVGQVGIRLCPIARFGNAQAAVALF
jgi:hypothetical protein